MNNINYKDLSRVKEKCISECRYNIRKVRDELAYEEKGRKYYSRIDRTKLDETVKLVVFNNCKEFDVSYNSVMNILDILDEHGVVSNVLVAQTLNVIR